MLVEEYIAVTESKDELVGIGDEVGVVEGIPLDETIILDEAELDKRAVVVYIDDSVFTGDVETVTLIEYEDTGVPVKIALVEKDSKLVIVAVMTPLDVLETV